MIGVTVIGMFEDGEDNVVFAEYIRRPNDRRTYAVDKKGVEWVTENHIDWESIEPHSRQIKRPGLTIGDVAHILQQQQAQQNRW